MADFTHFDSEGKAIMVDVSTKDVTVRTAVARGSIVLSSEAIDAVLNHTSKKGDVLGVARVAGIMAVKNTATLIPLCHPLPVNKCSVDFEVSKERCVIEAVCEVKTEGKTGVEMEALTGVSVALLAIYDMCKAIDKKMILTEIYLDKKSGGRSGDFSSGRTFDER